MLVPRRSWSGAWSSCRVLGCKFNVFSHLLVQQNLICGDSGLHFLSSDLLSRVDCVALFLLLVVE
jgi:hypothetical protein